MSATLPKILWLWIPLGILAVQAAIELFVPHSYQGMLHGENGPHEVLQFMLALGGLVYALRCIPLAAKNPFLLFWVSCFALGCAYIAGEEVSWGQHIFAWGTPEFWAGVNDQNETNLHNTSSWLDQKPRLILLIGVVTGGLLFPLLQRLKPGLLPARFALVYPPATLGVTAALAIGTNLIDKIFEAFTGGPLLSRGSEVEELYLFYFVLLYLVILRRRLMQHQS